MSIYIRYPTAGGGSALVPIYALVADLPVSATNGQLAYVEADHSLYIYDGGWIHTGSDELTIGTIDSQPASADGAVIAADELIMQSASDTEPGLVNNTTQTLSGAKSLTDSLTLTGAGSDAKTIYQPGQALSPSHPAWEVGFRAGQPYYSVVMDNGSMKTTFVDYALNGIVDYSAIVNAPNLRTDNIATQLGDPILDLAVSGEALSITSNSDQIQTVISANATQTSDIFVIRDSSTGDILNVNDSGDLTVTGDLAAANLSGTNTGDVTLTAVGAAPSANGATLSGQALTLQPADGTHPGLLTSGAQTIGGAKTFSGAISASNLSGTNTGDVTLGTANGLSLVGQALSLALSSTSTTGSLSSTDWNTFNGKQASLTIGNLTDAGTDGIVITGGTGAIIGSGTSIAQHVADSTHNGYLTSTDWSTFNGKLTSTLSSANIFVGNVSNVATGVAMSGAISVDNAGATSYSGTVPLNKGGTGQTTKAPAFDALSPMSASGDIIYGGASGTGTRLAKGSDGQVLTLASGLPSWAAAGGSSLTFTTITTTHNISASETACLFTDSGSPYTATLPDPTTVSGKSFYFKKTTNSLTVITITHNGSETIDGFNSITLCTQYEEWTIVSDGTNWQVFNHKCDTPWKNDLTFAPQGFGSVTNGLWYRRVGDTVEVDGYWLNGTVSATTAGINLPSGITIDTAKRSSATNLTMVGSLAWADPGASSVSIYTANSAAILFYDGSTNSEIFITNKSASTAFTKIAGNNQWNNSAALSVFFSVPVTSWMA